MTTTSWQAIVSEYLTPSCAGASVESMKCIGMRVRALDEGDVGTVIATTPSGGIKVMWDCGAVSWTNANAVVVEDEDLTPEGLSDSVEGMEDTTGHPAHYFIVKVHEDGTESALLGLGFWSDADECCSDAYSLGELVGSDWYVVDRRTWKPIAP